MRKAHVDDDQANRRRIVVGLGNPGRKYTATRHNVGFTVTDALAERWLLGTGAKAFGGLVFDGRVGERRVMLLQPHTFMNCSGQSVKSLVTYYKVAGEDVLIVLDDMALPVGRIRVRRGGSAGGHKGLADVIRLLETEEVARLRIGIGAPPQDIDAVDFVLRRFEGSQVAAIRQAVLLACEAASDWLVDEIDDVMTKYNGINLNQEQEAEDE